MIRTFLIIIFICVSTICSQTNFSCNASARCGCSFRPAVISRILNGEVAPLQTWGWMVSLIMNDTYICGGTLITSSSIITTFVCASPFLPSQIIVSAGNQLLTGPRQTRVASRIILHPGIDWYTGVNNIALIEIEPPFNMSDPSVALICLPSVTNDDYPPINSSLVATGWGMTTINSTHAENSLQQVTLQRIENNLPICLAVASNVSVQICVWGDNGNKTVCLGDTGGPMMMFTKSRQWVLVGVISHSLSCSNTGFPSVAGRVTSYLNWIASMNITNTVTVSAMDPLTETTAMTTASSATSTITVTSAGHIAYFFGSTSFRWLMSFIIAAVQMNLSIYLVT